MTLDPSLFRPEAIDPETAEFNRWLAEAMAGAPRITTLPPAVTRANRESGSGPFGKPQLSDVAQDRTITGPGGDLRIRTFVVGQPKAVYVFIHGGGWVLGAAHMHDVPLEAIARAADVAVVSVDYRLAPEHRYPAGSDDCEAAALWVLQQGKAEFGTDRLLIGGESAGAHLAVTTLLRLRDKHDYRLALAANLVFGVYDLRHTPSSAGARGTMVLDAEIMAWFADHFVDAGRRCEPDVSPLFADLRGLPPALFTVGTLDPLVDDTLFMHARWVAAGNEAELAVYPGGVHGFVSHPSPVGRKASERVSRFLQAAAAR